MVAQQQAVPSGHFSLFYRSRQTALTLTPTWSPVWGRTLSSALRRRQRWSAIMTTPPSMNWYNFHLSYPLSVIYHSHSIIWFSIRLVGRFKKVMLSSFANGPVLHTVSPCRLFSTYNRFQTEAYRNKCGTAYMKYSIYWQVKSVLFIWPRITNLPTGTAYKRGRATEKESLHYTDRPAICVLCLTDNTFLFHNGLT